MLQVGTELSEDQLSVRFMITVLGNPDSESIELGRICAHAFADPEVREATKTLCEQLGRWVVRKSTGEKNPTVQCVDLADYIPKA